MSTIHLDDALLESELFRAFPKEAHGELQVCLAEVTGASGEVLFEQGSTSDCLYLIRRGRADVMVSSQGMEQLVASHGPGASVGEVALVTGARRSARVVMHGDFSLLRLSQPDFVDLGSRYPDALTRYTSMLLPRIRRAQAVGAVVSLFGQLAPAALDDLLDALESCSLFSGEVLFRQIGRAHV